MNKQTLNFIRTDKDNCGKNFAEQRKQSAKTLVGFNTHTNCENYKRITFLCALSVKTDKKSIQELTG